MEIFGESKDGKKKSDRKKSVYDLEIDGAEFEGRRTLFYISCEIWLMFYSTKPTYVWVFPLPKGKVQKSCQN